MRVTVQSYAAGWGIVTYHDGRFATLKDVLEHYNGHFKLGLSDQEKVELTEYLKSL